MVAQPGQDSTAGRCVREVGQAVAGPQRREVERVVQAGYGEHGAEHAAAQRVSATAEHSHQVDRLGRPATGLKAACARLGELVMAEADGAGQQQRVPGSGHRLTAALDPAVSASSQARYLRIPSASDVAGDQLSSSLASRLEMLTPS